MNIFYTPDINDRFYILDPAESSHCIKVLRYSKGSKVRLIDGKGGFFEAVIVDDNWKACGMEIVSENRNYEPLPYHLEIAIAPTKNTDRFEWFLEKATEIGVSVISPVICERSERKQIRMDRMEKVVISAMKQSLKAYKPLLNEPVPVKDWMRLNKSSGRYIAHCVDDEKALLWNVPVKETISIAIGPEGDFTPDEIHYAVNVGFKPVSLGEHRLRTETAGIVACSSVYTTAIK